MWAQEWTDIYDLVVPYPNEPSTDISQALSNKGARAMVVMAERFFSSLGLGTLPTYFWVNEIQ